MRTDLPVGTYARFRYKSAWDFVLIVSGIELGEKLYRLLDERDVPDGAVVHSCVWRGDELVSVRISRKAT